VIGIGLLITFVPRLKKYVRAQNAARARVQTSP